MRRTITFVLLISFFALSACSQGQPSAPQALQPTTRPQLTPTDGDALSGLSEPTVAPTVAPTVVPHVTQKVQRGTIDDHVTINGQVAPLQHAVSFSQDGVLKRILVQAGQQVKQGQLVAELDLGDLEIQLRQAQLTVKQDQAQIDRTKQAAQLVIQQAKLNLETENARLQTLKAPPTAVAIAQAQNKLRQAQTQLDTTRNTASQTKNLAYLDMIDAQRALNELRDRYNEAVTRAAHPPRVTPEQPSKADELQKAVEDLQSQVRQGEDRLSKAVVSFDTARNNEVAAVQQGEAAVAAAQTDLDAVLAGSDPAAVAEQERVVQRANLAVEQAQQQAAPDPAQQHAVQSDALQIQQVQAQIADRQLYAPISGEVASVNLSAGSPVQIGSPVLTLVDSGHFEIVADATDALADGRTSLLQVNPGQAVAISFSRYVSTTFTGAITQVPKMTSAATQNATYHISFDAQGRDFSTGDLGAIEIALGRKYDALWLPPAAVHITPDRTYVVVLNGNDTRRMDITTGIVTASQVEILRGLQEGDTVVEQ